MSSTPSLAQKQNKPILAQTSKYEIFNQTNATFLIRTITLYTLCTTYNMEHGDNFFDRAMFILPFQFRELVVTAKY